MIRWWQYFSQWEIYTWNMLGTKKDFIETIWFKRELKEKKDIFVGEAVDNTFMVLIHFLVSWALTRDDVGTQMLGTFTDTTHCSYFTLDLNNGQFLIAMRCRCFFYNNDAMSMFLPISYHRNRCDFFWQTIGTDCFPMVFPIQGLMFGDDFLCGNLKTASQFNLYFMKKNTKQDLSLEPSTECCCENP